MMSWNPHFTVLYSMLKKSIFALIFKLLGKVPLSLVIRHCFVLNPHGITPEI